MGRTIKKCRTIWQKREHYQLPKILLGLPVPQNPQSPRLQLQFVHLSFSDSRLWLIWKKSRKMCFSMAFPDNLVCYSDTAPRGVRRIGFTNTGKCIPTFNPVVRSGWMLKCEFLSWCLHKSGKMHDLSKTNCIKGNFPTQTRGHGLGAAGKICSTSKWVIEFRIQER